MHKKHLFSAIMIFLSACQSTQVTELSMHAEDTNELASRRSDYKIQVIKPDSNIHYKILKIEPDTSHHYHILKLNPEHMKLDPFHFYLEDLSKNPGSK